MKIKILKKSILLVCSLALLTQVYLWAEPTFAIQDDDEVIVTLNVETGITISKEDDVTMLPTLGIASDTSIGQTSWTVKTNNVAGYNLNVKASSSPAMVHSNTVNSFADYSETSSGVPETWSVASGDYEFGFSAYGDDVEDTTWGVGVDCGTSSTISTNDLNYLGFKTTDKTIATRSSVTPNVGVETNICFAAEQKDVYAPSGVYTATITATAVTL
ncbi:MAG TPA: hypothetical protein PKK32_01655 [Candidatus Paceibacterota bacterium]|nr:hypothetical protein [Candidatus Paceibacterota bacterium]HQM18870.1 hypothetical protein [Candidatus Paceibacterota bacterium]